MSFLAELDSDNSSHPTPKEKISARVSVLVHSYLCVRFDRPSSINFRDINGLPKLGAKNPY